MIIKRILIMCKCGFDAIKKITQLKGLNIVFCSNPECLNYDINWNFKGYDIEIDLLQE